MDTGPPTPSPGYGCPTPTGSRTSQIVLGRADGVHPKIAQERLGHSAITTTMDLYSHMTDTMQADAATRLDAAFRLVVGRGAK
jgi:integrase